MFHRVLLCSDFGGLRLTFDGAGDCFLRGAIVEILDLLIVLGFPVDEYADGDEEIVGFVRGDYAFGYGIGDRHCHCMLRRTEHLHSLTCILDGHFVVEDRRRFTHEVWCDQRKKGGEAILVVGEPDSVGRLDGAASRAKE